MLRSGLLALLAWSVASGPTDQHTTGGYITSFQDIAGWDWTWLNVLLANVTVPIPDLQVQQAGFTVDITNLKCNRIQIGKLEFASKANDFSFEIRDTQMACSALLSYYQSTVRFPYGSVELRASTSGIQMAMSMTLIPNVHKLPVGSRVRSCSANARVELDFGGMILASILTLFQRRVESVVESAIQSQLCTALVSAVDKDLSPLLASTAQSLLPYVVAPSTTPSPPLPSPLIDWKQSPAMETIRSVSHRLGPNGINKVSRSFADANGKIFLPMDASTSLASAYASLDARLVGFEVVGLDSFQKFEPLEASGTNELRSRLALGEVRVTAVTEMLLVNLLDVNGPKKIPIKVNLTVAMVDIDLAAKALVAIHEDYKERIARIPVSDVSQMGCWLSILAAARLTNLGLSYSKGPNFYVSGYDSGFAKTSSNMLMMFVDLFRDAIPNILATTLNSHAREATNGAISDRLKLMQCNRHVVTSKFENLNEFLPLKLLREQLDTSGSWLNSIIQSALGGSVSINELIDRVVLSSSNGQANLKATVRNLEFGIGHITNLTFMLPTSPTSVTSRFEMGTQDGPMSAQANVALAYTDATRVKSEAYSFRAELLGIGGHRESTLLIDSNAYHALTLGDLMHGDKVSGIIAELTERTGNALLPSVTLRSTLINGKDSGIPFYGLLSTVGLDLFFDRLPSLVASLTDAEPLAAAAILESEKRLPLQGMTMESSVAIGVVVAFGVATLVLGLLLGMFWESRRFSATVIRPADAASS